MDNKFLVKTEIINILMIKYDMINFGLSFFVVEERKLDCVFKIKLE